MKAPQYYVISYTDIPCHFIRDRLSTSKVYKTKNFINLFKTALHPPYPEPTESNPHSFSILKINFNN